MYIGFFFFNDTATTEIYTLSLHDALPISDGGFVTAYAQTTLNPDGNSATHTLYGARFGPDGTPDPAGSVALETVQGPLYQRSEEHTSELQSRQYLVCRLLLEKKKKNNQMI